METEQQKANTNSNATSACGARLGGASINTTDSRNTTNSKGKRKKSETCTFERYWNYCVLGPQFDLLNWFYWNLWWQQYSFWNSVHHESFNQHWNGTPGIGTGHQPPTTMPIPLNGNIGIGPFTQPQNGLGIRTRIISGIIRNSNTFNFTFFPVIRVLYCSL